MEVSKKNINCNYYRFVGFDPKDINDVETSGHDCTHKNNGNYRNTCNINECPLKLQTTDEVIDYINIDATSMNAIDIASILREYPQFSVSIDGGYILILSYTKRILKRIKIMEEEGK